MSRTNNPHLKSSSLEIDSRNLVGDIDGHDLAVLSPRLDALRAQARAWREASGTNILSLPFIADIRAFRDRAEIVRAHFARTVVFGTGGSSLGGEMLASVLGDGSHPVTFYDNIDHLVFEELRKVDWRSTQLVAISKSGETPETLSQVLVTLPQIEAQVGKDAVRERIIVITENPGSALGSLARELKLELIPHPPIGGRYSVLSVVGLLPAAIAGADIEALIRGAQDMSDRCVKDDFDSNPAFQSGAAIYLHAARGRTQSVMMVYGERLRAIARWYRQLCAESLGKIDIAGRHHGLTPIDAYGITDQHSQLQLYLDGPDDKLFTFVTSSDLRKRGEKIPRRFGDIPGAAQLAGHTTGELFMAEFDATRLTIAGRKRPVRTFTLPLDDCAALGSLLILLEMEIVVTAELMGIDPFDQPAVEQGKILARKFLKEPTHQSAKR